ncbi:hypothetical protein B0G69_1335 [Paraburkholderia sp. RAU2J]|uniref:hypothetical protein n=1 Tax=Paraburkholderia sp. RAU2J TaxID=1938810 RepID=UPI000EAD1C5A|nr:hypothetical protein [Paraburkholderia sp. RAU2J]RKT25616.1 hypothetical protein B0G69_1335 [Paraburkholderia sp. RAU2J]
MTDSTNDVFTLDHFRRALGDVSDLHYDDLHEIPYMNVATRLYLTAGVAVMRISANVTVDFGNVTDSAGLGVARC